MQQQAASKKLVVAIGLLGVALTIGNVVLFAFVNWLQHSPPSSDGLLIQLCSAEAFMSAEGSLVAIWIAFGTRPLPVRLALAVPGVAIVFLPTLTLPNAALAFGMGLILVAIGSVPSLAARATGWQVIRFSTATGAENWQPGEMPMQFTLRQMFSWTLAVAMVASLPRLLIGREDFRPGSGVAFLIGAAVCIAWGLVALAAVWATLGSRHPCRRLLAVVVITGLVALLFLWLVGENDQFLRMVAGWATLDALLTGFGLLLFRPAGFRLVRYRRNA
jgi:hypothetical protein